MQVSLAEAKARFAEMIRRAESGEEIVLTRHGRPVAHLTSAAATKTVPLLGALSGKVHLADDFDELPEEFMAVFSGADPAR